MKLYALLVALGISSQALAADATIEMLNKDADGNKMVFSEEIVRIGVGDTHLRTGRDILLLVHPTQRHGHDWPNFGWRR